MDLLNNEPKIENIKNKKIMRIIIISVAILILLSIILVSVIMYLQAIELKVIIDGKERDFSKDYFVFENNTVYVPIKDFAKLMGYDAYNGEYKKNTENPNKCYIESANEIAMFSLESNKIYKTKPEEVNYESFVIQNPVIKRNGKLYISSEGIKIACNINFTYTTKTNTITIETLSQIIKRYSSKVKSYGYNSLVEDFNAQKAILNDLMVVQKENKKIGVITKNGEDIIGAKYNSIRFIESAKEFFVTDDNNKIGILSIKGDVKIPLENDDLQLLDNNLKLYVATTDGKKGVLNENGKIIIHKEYDEIGIDSTKFPTDNIENKYLLFENVIPVMKDGKYGLYDKDGNEILPLNYSGFGYVANTTKEKSVNNVLTIPEYKAIVLSINYDENNTKYGLVNYLGEEIIPFGLEEIYSKTSQGKEEYYVVYQGKEISLNEIKLNPTSTTGDKNIKEESENANTTSTTNTNTNTNELTSSDTKTDNNETNNTTNQLVNE